MAEVIKKAEKYPALTGIRALGAMFVFFDHFPLATQQRVVVNVLSFFFVLSGFLIVRLYYNETKPFAQRFSQYFINRFARIYPVYFLLLTAAVYLRHQYTPLLLLKNYTLTHALFFNYGDFIIQPSWSLTVEECFYFLAPLIMFIIRKRGFIQSIVFASSLLALALVVSLLPMVFLHTPTFVFSTTFFGHYAEFYAGIGLALVVIEKENMKPDITRKGFFYTLCGTVGIVVLICIMGYVYSKPVINSYFIILINNFLIPLPIALLYYGLICEHTIVARMLSGRLFGVLGRSSYAFYLLHTIIINYISIPVLQHIHMSRPICILATFLVTQVLSVIIYLYYEQPLNILIRNRFTHRNTSLG